MRRNCQAKTINLIEYLTDSADASSFTLCTRNSRKCLRGKSVGAMT